MVLQVSGPVESIAVSDFEDSEALGSPEGHFFRVVANADGTFTITDAILGETEGLLVDADLFTLELVGQASGLITVDILSYKLRTPDNQVITAEVSGADYQVDCTAPAPVAGIGAAPHHNRVAVTWSHDGASTARYEIFRGLWYDTSPTQSAYPEFDDLPSNVQPTRPSSPAVAMASAEWEWAGSVPVGANVFQDVFPDATRRGIYFYEVFAVDEAGNACQASATGDLATNYWLGDLDANGFVDITHDITVLGASYGTAEGDPAYNACCDVGPTSDMSRVGLPTTDNLVGFEDLMVFAMNAAVATDENKVGRPGAGPVRLSWVRMDDHRYALHLTEGHGVKGVRVRAAVESTVSAGTLVGDQASQVFFRNVGQNLDLGLAMLGAAQVLQGHGELILVDSAARILPEDLDITLRGVDNSEIDYRLDSFSDTVITPVFGLHASYPNPFNPRTNISFTLSDPRRVQLAVYGLDGHKVATLVDEQRSAGLHEVFWEGRDDQGRQVASGVYCLRIQAGTDSQIRKVVLMK